jgi:hypothetical protein
MVGLSGFAVGFILILMKEGAQMVKRIVRRICLPVFLTLFVFCFSFPGPSSGAQADSPRIDKAVLDFMAQPDDHAAIAVIVQSQQGTVKAARAVKAAGGMITAELRLIRAVAARVDRAALAKLARSSQLEAITLDYQAQSTSVGLEQNKFEPIAYAKGEPFPEKFYVAPLDLGAKKICKDDITGVGVTVAVVDTGIEATKFMGHQTVDEDGFEHPQR